MNNDMKEVPMNLPNIPACVGEPAHNFQPLSPKQVYCTKCAANVRFTHPKKDK